MFVYHCLSTTKELQRSYSLFITLFEDICWGSLPLYSMRLVLIVLEGLRLGVEHEIVYWGLRKVLVTMTR